MNAVNERMGYRLVEQLLEVQKKAVTHRDPRRRRARRGRAAASGGRPVTRRRPTARTTCTRPGSTRASPWPRTTPSATSRCWRRTTATAMVGIGVCQLPLLDNTHLAFVDIGVPPAHRGRGVGSALLSRAEELARTAGRTHWIADAFTPVGGTSAGARFAAAHGYEVANTEGFKVLDLRDHPDWEAAGRARRRSAAAATGSSSGRASRRRSSSPTWRAPSASFMSMVPTGDLALEDGEWTPERYVENERRVADRNRCFAAAAISPDGEFVGYTDVNVSRAKTTQGVGRHHVRPAGAPRPLARPRRQAGQPPVAGGRAARVRARPHQQRRRQRAHERRQRAAGLPAGRGHARGPEGQIFLSRT